MNSVLIGSASLLLIGSVLLISLRLIYAGVMPSGDPLYVLIRTTGLVVLALGWCALLVSSGSMLGFFLWTASLVIIAMGYHQYRIAQQQAHLALVAIAVEKQIALPECIDAFAREQGGRFGAKVRRFAEELRAGTPLPVAIGHSRGVLPAETKLAALIGQQCDRLAAVLRDQSITQHDYEPLRRALAARLLYVYLLVATGPFLATFMVIKIAPSYAYIFRDFEMDLPAISQWFLDSARYGTLIQATSWLSFFSVLLVGYGALWYMGWVHVLPPGLNRLLLRFDRGTILRALAFPAEQREPLGPMIDALAADYPKRWIRRRLGRAARRIAAGEDWIGSLRAQGLLGRADAGVLQAAARVGNLAWALREMAESNERRLIYRLDVLLQIGSVLLIGVFGVMTLLVAVTFFLPLVQLIANLSDVY